MLKRTLFTALAATALLAFAASAHAAYLSMGTSNTSNATTTLKGTTTGSELYVENDSAALGASALYGFLKPTSATVNDAAVRGTNSATTGYGYGLYGTQAGSGAGVYGYTPSGRGVAGYSSTGTGVYGVHSSKSGTTPGVSASTNSTAANANALVATVTPAGAGDFSAAVKGVNNDTNAHDYGLYGQSVNGYGVYGTGVGAGGYGVQGSSGSSIGVNGTSGGSCCGVAGYAPFGTAGSFSGENGVSVKATAGNGVTANTANGIAVLGNNAGGAPMARGVVGDLGLSGYGSCGGTFAVGGCGFSFGMGVVGDSSQFAGTYGYSNSGDGIYGGTNAGYAGWFQGNVNITGTLTSGVKDFKIDDPLDPAHKYLLHTSVESSSMMDIYNGNVTTDAKGFATVTMPNWFQALNQTFRYQLTIVGTRGWNARVVKGIAHNRFTIQTDQPRVKVSWQVTGVRHDPYANANRTQVVMPKSKADQGKYLHPELYGQPKTDAIGYQKPPQAPRVSHSR